MAKFKADSTWQGALIQSDYLADSGDQEGADRWQLLGRVQYNAQLLWAKYGHAWTKTELRKIPMSQRTKGKRFEVNGQNYILEGWFAQGEVIFTLYIQSKDGAFSFSDGHKYRFIENKAVRRSTIYRHGPDIPLRNVADRLTIPQGK